MSQASLVDGLERGMVEGDELYSSPCHKLSHTTSIHHTNLSRRYTLQYKKVEMTEYKPDTTHTDISIQKKLR